MRGRSSVSTWGFFLYSAWALLGLQNVAATSSTTSSSTYPGCSGYVPFINDSVCDGLNNNADCGYDGGDCCSCTCVDSLTKSCGYDADFNCTDPNVPDDCGETPSPAAAFGFPNCTGYIWDLGDGFCDDDLNNEECGYDGGDCCRCTCRSSYDDYCGYYGYDCLDPDVPTDCDSASPTPSPAAALGYPDCTGDMNNYQTGYCTSSLNNEECGYDGGDCCRCTCQDGTYSTCGVNGYDCLDPDAPMDCDTASPTPSPAAAFGFPNCAGYLWDLGNEFCDDDLNNEECGYDGGDCCRCTCRNTYYDYCGYYGYDCLDPDAPTDCESASPTPSPAAALGYPDCTVDMSGFQTGYCTSSLNNEECGYDGGDCCRCTCQDGISYTCGVNGYDCLDPDAPTDCDTASPTPSPAAALGYPDCTGDMSGFQTGYCTSSLNNEECGYDGGDCCRCTCEDSTYYCGSNGYNCSDPNADTDCPTPSPTPTPAAGLGYPNCTGDMSDLQNGYCDWDLNNEDCGYDEGDCCRCTCEEGLTYTCGDYGFDCEDPDAPTDCPTPSPTPTPAAGLGYPDCTGDMSDLQNGYCDSDLNNEECGYDEGDCCRCTCEEGLTYTCGDYGFDCEDPDAPTDCPTPSPTPTPAAGLGYPDCTGDMSDLQNGYCDSDLNNEDCGYDGGDCCSCTCEDGIYTCGNYDFNCLDPGVDCPTPSPTPTPAAGLGYPECNGDMSDLQNGYCDWDLNNEDCGYDGGDCCECSCTEGPSGYHCGEGGYECLDPDPCPSPSAKMSSTDIIVMAAIIFIASLCMICAGCFVVVCMRVKMRAKTAGTNPTAHTTSVSPPQQSIPRTTINNRAGQQPPIPHPVVSANPSRQVDVVNPQNAAAQSRQRSTAVMPRGQRAPPSTHGESFARVASSRCALIPEGSALDRPPSMVVVGHRPNSDTIEAKRIQLAITESVRVQTISEAIFQQKIRRPQSVAYPAITGTGGGNPSDIVNSVNAEEKIPSDAEKKNNGQDEDTGSEWGSDGEGGMEEKIQQDNNDELGTEDDQQPDTGGGNGDDDRPNEPTGPIGTDKDSLSGITNDAYIEENISRNSDEGDNDQDAGSVSECISDGEGGTEEDGCQDANKPYAEVDQATGTKVGDDVDEQEGIMVPIGPACEEDADNTPHGGTRAEPSDNEG